MVSRVISGVSFIPDEYFEKLAGHLNKDHKKLFSVVKDEQKAKELKEKLISQGYSAAIKPDGNVFHVLYSSKTSKIKVTAYSMSCFTPIGDNLYKSIQKVAGVYDYDFDDGAIWRVEQFEDGEYLVKEINSDDENDIIRSKTASSVNVPAINDDIFIQIMKMFYGQYTDEIIKDIIDNDILKKEFQKVVCKKLDNEIAVLSKKYHKTLTANQISKLRTRLLSTIRPISKISLEKAITANF